MAVALPISSIVKSPIPALFMLSFKSDKKPLEERRLLDGS